MNYFALEPEVAGNIFGVKSVVDVSVHPPKVTHLDYQFDGWLDDEILASFPCFIVTLKLKNVLATSKFSGVEFDACDVSRSDAFDEWYPDKQLPNFAWLKVFGRAGVDDFGLYENKRLVVSEPVLKTLQQFHFEHCTVKEFEPEKTFTAA